MKFEQELKTGRLIKRYKRFLADIRFDDGTETTAHVPNTGSMKSTNTSGSLVALSYHPSPTRKLKWTLELIQGESEAWVGVNTSVTNRIVEHAIQNEDIQELIGYENLRREVKYGKNSRIDLLLESPTLPMCYVEVKNVTYKEGPLALFPDAVTKRGTKHLHELTEMVRQGHRAVCFFLVNRADCEQMSPAQEIDPVYADACRAATQNGVELIAYHTNPGPLGIEMGHRLEIVLE